METLPIGMNSFPWLITSSLWRRVTLKWGAGIHQVPTLHPVTWWRSSPEWYPVFVHTDKTLHTRRAALGIGKSKK